MEFSRQEYWSGLPFPSPGDLPDPGIEPGSPELQAGSLPSEPPGKLKVCKVHIFLSPVLSPLSFSKLWKVASYAFRHQLKYYRRPRQPSLKCHRLPWRAHHSLCLTPKMQVIITTDSACVWCLCTPRTCLGTPRLGRKSNPKKTINGLHSVDLSSSSNICLLIIIFTYNYLCL